MTNRLELNWKLGGFVDEQRYYCSETPIDVNNLPVQKAILAGDVLTYVDTNIEVGKTYYVRIGSVKNGVEKISAEASVYTYAEDMINVVALLKFNGAITDATGKNWTVNNVSLVGNQAIFNTGYLESQVSNDFSYGLGDFEWKVQLELSSISGNQYIVDHGGGNTGALSYYNHEIRYYNPATGVYSNLYNTGISLAIGTKYIIEVKRVLGVTSIYIDGVLRASGSDTYNYTETKCWVGRYPAGTSQYLNGKIDYFRIKKIPQTQHLRGAFLLPKN